MGTGPGARVYIVSTAPPPALAAHNVYASCSHIEPSVAPAVCVSPGSDSEFAYTPVGVLVDVLVPSMAMLVERAANTKPP